MNPTSPLPGVRDLLVERLDSLLNECDQVMDDAAYGQTIHDLDDFLLIAGKKFLQEVFQKKLQQRIEQVQQQPETKRCPACKKKRNTKTKKRKR
jgi:hypothetical protein